MTNNAFPLYFDAVKECDASLKKADGSFAEATLYNMLRAQLPESWSFIWGVQLGAHEYDFLIMVPGRGIVNMECKGHGYEPIGGTNKFRWFNRETGEWENKDLLGQASAARRYYVRYLQDALFGQRYQWGVMAYCVVFPLDEMSGINFKAVPIFRESDCLPENMGLEKIVLQSLDFAERQLRGIGVQTPAQLTQADAAKIWEYWTQKEDPSVHKFTLQKLDLAGYRQQMRDLLTVSQQSVQQVVLDPRHLRVLVEGTAGTGKTLLAMSAAAELRGKVLYVCFNRVLARHVHMTLPERDGLVITHFHKFPDDVMRKPIDVTQQEGETDAAYWSRRDEVLLQEVRNLKAGTYPLFDAIIVDEAQDLTRTQLKCLMRFCNSNGGKLVLFSDAEQGIYPDRMSQEELRRMFRDLEVQSLTVNLRNPRPVVNYCNKLVPQEKQVVPILYGPDVAQKEMPQTAVNTFLRNVVFKSFNPRDVAVISPESKYLADLGIGTGVSFYGPNDNLRKTEKNLIAWTENRCAWKSTTHAFKGLEAMAVVHLLPQTYASNALKYVGASRATFQLYLITIEE